MDFGWAELLIIGVVALIVIGPKDLPEMFRTLGRFTAKARSMARDFSRAMEQAARDSGVDEVAKDLKDIKSATSPRAMGLDAVKSAADKFEKWDPLKNAAKPTAPPPKMPVPPPMPAAVPPTPAMAAAAAEAAPTAAAPAKPPLGPATQALADKQAKKAAIARETAEKLRAVDAEPAPVKAAPAKSPPAKSPPAKAAPKAAKEPAAPAAAKPPAKRAPAAKTAKAQDKTE